MPHVSSVSQTGLGYSDELVFKRNDAVRAAYTLHVTGTVTYSLQHSIDGVNWVNNEDATDLTADADGNYVFPMHGVRLYVSSGTGTVTLVLGQTTV